ncbi:uncharacterized protein LOC129757952 isoform X2 [Uranotaenia lowii]|nr:uncharacterized protein LOC129757952 isoform X2 [Uranotaenia lowii]
MSDCHEQYVNLLAINNNAQYCRQLSTSAECIRKHVADILVCLPEMEPITDFFQAVHGIQEKVCYKYRRNSTELMLTFPQWRCAAGLSPIGNDCANTLGKMQTIRLEEFSFRECHDIVSMRDCFSQQLVECRRSSELVSLYNKYMRNLLKLTPCEMPENAND